MANQRTIARLQARIHERAAHCLEFEIADPRASFITITRVELAPDLSGAKVFYSVLGGKADRSRAEHMLASAGGYIQRKVAGVLQVRRAPRLTWVFDEAVAEAARLERLIGKALDRDKEIQEKGTAPEIEGEDWEREYDDFSGSKDDEAAPPPPPPPPPKRA